MAPGLSGGPVPVAPETIRPSAASADCDLSRPSLHRHGSLYPLLVPHGGLVLLHPFLGRFLANCGVTDPKGLSLRDDAFPRAAALLHFLAMGTEDIHEFEIGLEKVLLGLSPETPLPVCPGLLTVEDQEEADALLASAIGHWSVLGKTSVEGFRSTFLQRPGQLRQGEDGWRLQVERMGLDALLDYLPWGISIARMPWMEKPVHIQW